MEIEFVYVTMVRRTSSALRVCWEVKTKPHRQVQLNNPACCLSNSGVTQKNVSAMTSEVDEENKPDGRCLLGNWVEEVCFTACLNDPAGWGLAKFCLLSWWYICSCSMNALYLIILHLYNDMLHFSFFFFHAFQRATALLDRTGPRSCVHKHGHTGILTLDVAAKVQGISTFKATFNSPKSLGVRQKGRLKWYRC